MTQNINLGLTSKKIGGVDLSKANFGPQKPEKIDRSKYNFGSTPNKSVTDLSKANFGSTPKKPVVDLSKANFGSTSQDTLLKSLLAKRTVTPITPPPLIQEQSPVETIKRTPPRTEIENIIPKPETILNAKQRQQLNQFNEFCDDTKEALRYKVWYRAGGKDNSSFGGDVYGKNTIESNPGVLFEDSPGSLSIFEEYFLEQRQKQGTRDLDKHLLEQKEKQEAIKKASFTSEINEVTAFLKEKYADFVSAAMKISNLISTGQQPEILINAFSDFENNEAPKIFAAITSKLNGASKTNPEIAILKGSYDGVCSAAEELVDDIRSQLDQKLAEINKAPSDSDDEEIPRLDGSDSEERTHEISNERTAIQNFISEGKKIQNNSEELFRMFDQLSDQTKKALAIEVWASHDDTQCSEGKGPIVDAVKYGLKAIKDYPPFLFEGSPSILNEYLSDLNQDSDTDEGMPRLEGSDIDEKTSLETNQPIITFFKENWANFTFETAKISTSILSELNPKELKASYSGFVTAMNQIYNNIESQLADELKTPQENALLEKLYKAFISKAEPIAKGIDSEFNKKFEVINKAASNMDKGRATSPNRNLDERVHGSPQEIAISEESIAKIHNFVGGMLRSDKDYSLNMFKAGYHLRLLDQTYPGLNFVLTKTSHIGELFGDSPNKIRYEAMIDAQAVINTHKLGLLVIPNAKLFPTEIEGEKYEIFAEEKLNVTPFLNGQEQHDQGYTNSLDETIRQLAVFICKTGYSNVQREHIPILNNDLDLKKGNRKIALINIDKMEGLLFEGAAVGLFGKGRQQGLVDYVNAEQAQIIKKVADGNRDENKIDTRAFDEAERKRKANLEEESKLKAYHEEKGITKGDELIQTMEHEFVEFNEDGFEKKNEIVTFVAEQELTFPNNDPMDVENLKSYTLVLINEINEQIKTNANNKTVKERRTIFIDIKKAGTFREMNNKLVKDARSLNRMQNLDDTTFLGSALNKLVELKVIHSFTNRNKDGYTIQA
jgi:hypothetical protein